MTKEKKLQIQPPENMSRKFGRDMNITPMLVAGKLILTRYVELPDVFTTESIQQVIDDVLEKEIGSEPVDEDIYTEAWAPEDVMRHLRQMLANGDCTDADAFVISQALHDLSELTSHSPSLSTETINSFVENTKLPLSSYMIQRLHPILITPKSIRFLREIRREITQGKKLIELFSGHASEAYLFILNALSQVIMERVTDENEWIKADEALNIIADKYDVNLSTDDADQYLSAMRLMNDGSVGSQIFHRLLRAQVYKEDLATITGDWIEELRQQANREEIANLILVLLRKAGVSALDQLVEARFGKERVVEVDIVELDEHGRRFIIDRNSLVRQLNKHLKEKPHLQDEEVRNIIKAIRKDLLLLDTVIVSLFTPQSYEWMLAGMEFSWRGDNTNPYESYLQVLFE